MSDDQSQWQPNPGPPPPPGPSLPQWSPPAPAAAPSSPMVGDLAPSPPSTPPRSSTGKILGALVGVGALLVAGVFALTQMSGGDDTGGAASPQQVGTQLMASLEREDVLGVVDLLLPGERETFRGPLVKLVDELKRVQVLDGSATLGKIGGVDFKFSGIDVTEEPTNVSDVTNLVISGAEETTVDGEQVPLGDLIIQRAFGGKRPPMDTATGPAHFDDMRLTAVQRAGRWYLSAFYSLAESQRGAAAVPEQGVTPAGAHDPQGAVDDVLQSAVALDVEGIIKGLNPNEAEALQRYAPLLLDQTKDLRTLLGDTKIALTNTSYSVKGSGSSRFVGLIGFQLDVTSGAQHIVAKLAGGCLTADVSGQSSYDSCDANSTDEVITQMDGAVPPAALDAVRKLLGTFEAAFADYESTGLKVDQIDGQWFLSPIGTSADFLLSVIGALDRQEIDGIIDGVSEFVATMRGLGLGVPSLVGTIPFDPAGMEGGLGGLTGKISGPAGTPTSSVADQPPATGTPPNGAALEALLKCYGITDIDSGVACVRQGIADGTIDPVYVLAPVAHPECGVAGPYFDQSVYSLSDAQFTAMVTSAAPCFRQLVDAGTLDQVLVPVELLRPDCLEGRNYYAAMGDTAYSDRVNACAHG